MTVEWGREEEGRRKGKMRTIKLTEGSSALKRECVCVYLGEWKGVKVHVYLRK